MNAKKLHLILAASLLVLSGCSATHTSINKNKLDIQTHMHGTIWLDPIKPQQRTIFVQIRNTSGHSALDISTPITLALRAKGYQLTKDPELAHYWLQANVLTIEKRDLRNMNRHHDHGYGAAVVGGAIGNTVGEGSGRVASSVAGALIGVAVDASVKDIEYVMITDLRIAEQTKLEGQRKSHQTRIVSTANQVNLELPEASPMLQQQLVNTISGLF